jgi:hypothetical protein
MTKLTQEDRNNDFNFKMELIRLRREKKRDKKMYRAIAREEQRMVWAERNG